MQTNAVPDLTLTTEPPPTRELTDHQFNELFEDFFNPDLGELALCKQHELTLDRLYEIFTSERFQRTLQRLEAIRQLRAQHQASLIQRDALAGLHNLTHARAPNATCAEASRKACMALLKLIPTQTEEVITSGRAATVRERSASSSPSPVAEWGDGGGVEPWGGETEGAVCMTDATPKVSVGAPVPFLSLEGEVDGTDRFRRVRGSSAVPPGPEGANACSHGWSAAKPVEEIPTDTSPRRGEGPAPSVACGDSSPVRNGGASGGIATLPSRPPSLRRPVAF